MEPGLELARLERRVDRGRDGPGGTQFDGFTHQTIGDSFYNCIDQNEIMTRTGFTRLGVHNFPQRRHAVSPNPDPQPSSPVHQIMLVVNGIHLVERMKLDEVAAAGVHEFALVVQPLKIQGGTGSTVAPVAIY